MHVNGEPRRSCVAPIGTLEGAEVTTIEGATGKEVEAVRSAWVAHDVPQCGYCQSGAILQAADLLNNNPNPGDADIIKAMNANLCRCMTYSRMKDAIKAAHAING